MASTIYESLAIPYVAVMYAVEENGEWYRRAEYPELPGCVTQAESARDAMEELEELRVRIIVDMHNRGIEPPRPRPPLKSGLATLGSVDVDELLERIFQEEEARKAAQKKD